MSAENNGAWYAFGGTVTGASHIRKQLPNQDAILWNSGDAPDLPIVLAIADGHGSEKYFRSDIGARLAVELAVEELELFAQALPTPQANISLFNHLVEQLPKKIVQKWQTRVTDHLAATPFFTIEEWQRYGNGTALPEITRNPLIPYGATLLTALVAKKFILYLQLGDGDIMLVSEDAQVSKPMKGDERLLANETTSLCSSTAAQDFRVHYDDLSGQTPALILLSTDGYSNSFTNEQGFLRVGADILKQLHEHGIDTVRKSLDEWLTAATHAGSGDDITLGLLYHKAAADEPVQASPAQTLPSETSLQQDEKEEELVAEHDREEIAVSPTVPEHDQEEVPIPSAASEETPLPATSHILTVSQAKGEGTGTYSTIGAALADARPLTRIEIQPGTYREKLLIDKDIELVGIGEAGSVTIVGIAPCLTLQAAHAQVQNVKIEAQAAPWWNFMQQPYAAVEITAGHSLLNNCEIIAGKIGVRVRGTTTSPVIQSCSIHDHTNTGVIFAEGALGLLVDSNVYTNKHVNIEITDGSRPIILRSRIYQGLGMGIGVHKGGGGRVEGCTIEDNKSTGVEITQQGHLLLLSSSISRNYGSGVIFTTQGGGNLVECEVAENSLHGIEIKGLCYPQIQHCRLREGKQSGIVIDGQGKGGGGFIEDCELTGQASTSILVQNASNPYIRACNIHDGQGVGLLVRQKAYATIDTSKITGDTSRCVEANGSGTSLIMNKVEVQQQGKTCALRFADHCYGQMERCQIIADSSTGVEIDSYASLYLRLCTIKSDSFALQLHQSSEAKVEGGSLQSHMHGNKASATSCDESSHVIYTDDEHNILY